MTRYTQWNQQDATIGKLMQNNRELDAENKRLKTELKDAEKQVKEWQRLYKGARADYGVLNEKYRTLTTVLAPIIANLKILR